MKTKIAVLIDGGHLRVYARKAKKSFVPDYIEKIAHRCALADEVIQRILYYDCPPYEGEAPVSGTKKAFSGSDKWLHDLSHKDIRGADRDSQVPRLCLEGFKDSVHAHIAINGF
jgi:hypothetical protein